MYMSILLPVVVFVSWLAISLAPAGKLAIEDARVGVPEDKRRGVSILPGFPLFPLLFWGLACLIDLFCAPWGSWSIIALHSIALVAAIFTIVRDTLVLRRIDAGHKSRGQNT